VHSGAPATSGWALFGQQTHALLVKNALMAWRNKAATFLQLFSSFFFIFLVFAINEAVLASLSGLTTFQNVFDPAAQPVSPIPACSTGYYLSQDCYDFVWSGNWSATVVSLVNNISLNNPGRPINFQSEVRHTDRSCCCSLASYARICLHAPITYTCVHFPLRFPPLPLLQCVRVITDPGVRYSRGSERMASGEPLPHTGGCPLRLHCPGHLGLWPSDKLHGQAAAWQCRGPHLHVPGPPSGRGREGAHSACHAE